ncbi:hypothetical protein KA005_47235, partial [bacterium]|nr:hypothetical protein [bacterium]
IATILVLAVAVAAGVGLYFWFDTFQASAQEEVESSSSASMNLMVRNSLGNDAITLSTYPGDTEYTITFAEVDDSDSAPTNSTTGNTLYPQGNGYIGIYRQYKYSKWLTSTSGGNGWVKISGSKNAQIYDERFIIEIPVTITPVLDIKDVLIKAGEPEVSEIYPETTDVNLYHTEYWLHIDRENNYQLQKKDDTPFKGIMRKSGSSALIEENTTAGDTFYFDGGNYYLTVDTATWNNYTGENMGSDFANVVTTNGTAPQYPGYPYSYKTGTYFRVLPLYQADGVKKYAYKKNNAGDEEGWYTNYFYGGTSIKEYFDSGWYTVGDLNKGESTTKYLYLMFNSISMPKHPASDDWREGDDEYIVFDVPITVTSSDGVTSTMTVKITVHDEE